jgi:chaperonin GroES
MDKKHDLPEGFYTANNLTDLLDDNFVSELGSEVKAQVQEDINSRKEWLQANDKHMELVTQVIKEKTYPWPNASNIKFPLISTAAVQFHARSFPTLMSGNSPVKCRVIGSDKGNLKAERAQRLSTFLSFHCPL